jgi:hypothetical protein
VTFVVPGTGKTVIKESLKKLPDKEHLVATVARTLHTYTNTVKILCEAFRIEFESSAFKCERKLIQEALVDCGKLQEQLRTTVLHCRAAVLSCFELSKKHLSRPAKLALTSSILFPDAQSSLHSMRRGIELDDCGKPLQDFQ